MQDVGAQALERLVSTTGSLSSHRARNPCGCGVHAPKYSEWSDDGQFQRTTTNCRAWPPEPEIVNYLDNVMLLLQQRWSCTRSELVNGSQAGGAVTDLRRTSCGSGSRTVR